MRGRALLVMIPIALHSYACGTLRTVAPAEPIVLQARTAELRNPLFDEVLGRFATAYLEPQRIQPRQMLDGAVSGLAKSHPELSTEVREDAIQLRVGGDSIALSHPVDLAELAGTLDATTAWLQGRLPPAHPLMLETTGLRGAVQAVDRWATVLYGSSRESLLNRFQGSLSGIGCRVGRRNDAVEILEVYAGGPAAQAGLMDGDRIVGVGDRDVRVLKVSEVVDLLRGEVGTVVRVEVERPGANQGIEYHVRRSRFVVPTVFSRILGGDVGYLKVTHIAKNSGTIAHRLIGGLQETSGLKGIVLDLRGNTGGSMLAAGEIADEFVARGVLIETKSRDGQAVPGLRDRIEATSNGDPDLPLVVLVDGQTGSSAEFLTAALVRHDRGVLLGERTFGKSLLQKTYTFGSSRDVLLKVTVARAFAGGAAVPEDGLQPDIGVLASEKPSAELQCARTPQEMPFATLSFSPNRGESADPVLETAAQLIRRYPLASRKAALDSIRRDTCDHAFQKTQGELPG